MFNRRLCSPLSNLHLALSLPLGRSHSSFDHPSRRGYCLEKSPLINQTASLVLLIFSSILVTICAEFLVNTIDEIVNHSALSEAFIGWIILPIVGNCAEHITAALYFLQC